MSNLSFRHHSRLRDTVSIPAPSARVWPQMRCDSTRFGPLRRSRRPIFDSGGDEQQRREPIEVAEDRRSPRARHAERHDSPLAAATTVLATSNAAPGDDSPGRMNSRGNSTLAARSSVSAPSQSTRSCANTYACWTQLRRECQLGHDPVEITLHRDHILGTRSFVSHGPSQADRRGRLVQAPQRFDARVVLVDASAEQIGRTIVTSPV